ncbi:hypothetical protein DAEQUDRAFT_723225 [Daedalea quercina L-15889]|uniref:Uncharacterized protein n=1 Tax=Daedalea quercina L-15889 TaxID=1314783 RepID=A0A165SJ22_9APHY|nr:hypothetical protein DAEQUDRAFT_723225 [Daedalea quercina L-15889]
MQDSVVLNLPINLAPPEQVPYQLSKYISAEAWQARLRAVVRKGSRYVNPRFDLAWGVLSFIATIAVPIAVFYVMLRALPLRGSTATSFDLFAAEANRAWEARGISFAIFIAIILVMWLPMWLFKLSGKKQVNRMLARFEQEDRAVKPNIELPHYFISRPRFMGNSIVLNVTVPGTAQPSAFAYGAPLPTYIVNSPSDPNAVAYTYGQPPVNMPGAGVPLYNQFDEKIPAYSGPAPGLYVPEDEKHEREDRV